MQLLDYIVSVIFFGDYVQITSYYSMYSSPTQVFYKFGYKIDGEISHRVTSDALIYYVRDKLKSNVPFLDVF